MRNATILVLRLKGVATEAIKNIVLAGVGKLIVVDADAVAPEDLGAGFFFRDADVGKKVRRKSRLFSRLALFPFPPFRSLGFARPRPRTRMSAVFHCPSPSQMYSGAVFGRSFSRCVRPRARRERRTRPLAEWLLQLCVSLCSLARELSWCHNAPGHQMSCTAPSHLRSFGSIFRGLPAALRTDMPRAPAPYVCWILEYELQN